MDSGKLDFNKLFQQVSNLVTVVTSDATKTVGKLQEVLTKISSCLSGDDSNELKRLFFSLSTDERTLFIEHLKSGDTEKTKEWLGSKTKNQNIIDTVMLYTDTIKDALNLKTSVTQELNNLFDTSLDTSSKDASEKPEESPIETPKNTDFMKNFFECALSFNKLAPKEEETQVDVSSEEKSTETNETFKDFLDNVVNISKGSVKFSTVPGIPTPDFESQPESEVTQPESEVSQQDDFLQEMGKFCRNYIIKEDIDMKELKSTINTVMEFWEDKPSEDKPTTETNENMDFCKKLAQAFNVEKSALPQISENINKILNVVKLIFQH